MKLLQAAGVLSLLLILVVVNSLLNSSGGESPFNPNPVAAAAEQTREAPGMRIKMTLQVTSNGGEAVTINGSGSYNGETKLAEVLYSATTSQGHVQFDAILGESSCYFRYPQFSGQLPEGKEWVKLEGLDGQSEKDTMGVESPDEMLETIAAAGGVKRAGQVKVGGEQTTRYQLTLSPEAALEVLRAEGKMDSVEKLENGSAQLVGPIRAEAFIDQHGILRRVRTSSSASVDGQMITSEARMDFFGFGVEPDIKVPDDSRAIEVDSGDLEALGQPS